MFTGLLTALDDYQRDVFRNIKSVRESFDCYHDLGDGDYDSIIAGEAEMLGQQFSHSPEIDHPFEYGVAISYPFLAENWHETRFSDGKMFGVWYGSEVLETTVHETIHHWCRFVLDSFAGEDIEVVSERRVFEVNCSGLLVDLRSKEQLFPLLHDKVNYRFCQQVGNYVHDQGQNALVVNSAHCDGVNVAVFDKKVLSNVRDYCYLTYRWNPVKATQVVVERMVGQGCCYMDLH